MEKLHTIYGALTIALFLGHVVISANAQENKAFALQKQLELVAHQFRQWENGTASFFDLLADDVNWEISGRSPVSGTYKSKQAFMERAVAPILEKLKEPLKPKLISLTADDRFIWLHFKAQAKTKTNAIYENTYIWKLQLSGSKIIHAFAFLDTYELVQLMQNNTIVMKKTIEETKGYIGMWVTADGHIRQELLPGNRYDEARGSRLSAYQGAYKVRGNDIFYRDDTGFTADGTFVDENTLHHGGYIFYKEVKDEKQ